MQKKTNIIINQIKYDIFGGIVYKWYSLIPVVVMVLLSCLQLNRLVDIDNEIYRTSFAATFTDYFTFFLKGEQAPSFLDNNTEISLPIGYLFFFTYIILVSANYLYKDFYENGYQYIIRLKSKYIWWIGKFVWMILSVVLYFAVVVLTIGAFNVMFGAGEFKPETTFVLEKVIKADFITNITDIAALIPATVQLIMATLLIFVCVCVLSVIINPLIGIFFGLISLSASIFSETGIFIGEHMMICRNYNSKNGISILIELIIVMLIVVVGYLIFRKKELIGRRIS